MPEHSAVRALVEGIGQGFVEFEPPSRRTSADGPLDWPGYADQRARASGRSDTDESVLCGRAGLGEREAVLIAFDFAFLGGSVGEDTGARIVAAFEHAREQRLPVISLIASGGSRMQEGIRALQQLQAITRACRLAGQDRIPHIAVLRDPTTGGMWAAMGAAADVVLAAPGARISFGGARVRSAGDDGEDFRVEGKFSDGQVDRVVEEADLPRVLAELVALLHPARLASPEPAPLPAALGADRLPETGMQAVERARATERPRAGEYLDAYFSARFEISGDRVGGRDEGMICGFGDHDGRVVAFAAQTGGRNSPAGFRTAARLIRLADKLGIPVLTLVDTPGAANDAEAERAGVGPAIAEVFGAVADARVPVTTLVIGEGGSGGALALAAPESTWVTADAYFAVIAPESAAAILKREPSEVPELAEHLRLRPQDLVELGFARGIAR